MVAGSDWVFQLSTMVSSMLVDSPDRHLKEIPCLDLKRFSQPSLHLKSPWPRMTESCTTRFPNRKPLIGMLCEQASRSHTSRVSSTSGNEDSCSLNHFSYRSLVTSLAKIVSFFLKIEFTVCLGSPKRSATSICFWPWSMRLICEASVAAVFASVSLSLTSYKAWR